MHDVPLARLLVLVLSLGLLALACSAPAPSRTSEAAPYLDPPPASVLESTPDPPAQEVLQSAMPGADSKLGSPGGAPLQSHPLIGIIAGHGGLEPGSVHRDALGRVDLVEKDLTLAVALRLRQLLMAGGYAAVLDRERDTAAGAPGDDRNDDGMVDDADDIQTRLDSLNAADADLLVSIHFNGFDSPAVRGTATYYCPDRPFAAESRRLAGLVQESVVARLRAAGAEVLDKGVQDDAVLGKPYGHLMTLGPATPRIARPGEMPGVLVEPLFLTNEYEAGLLKNESTREALAQGLAQAVQRYLSEPAAAQAPAQPPPSRPPRADLPPEVLRGPAVPMVSLTFDLGSGATHTPPILEALERHGIKTTFFMTGKWVEANPDMARRILELGHEPANHSYSHPNLTELADPEVVAELALMEEALQKAGRTSKPWFRFPFGARNERLLRLVAGQGYTSIYWTLDSADWRPELPAATIRDRVISQSTPGSIVVMHGDSPQTAQVLDAIIQGLRARGLEPVSLSRLLGE